MAGSVVKVGSLVARFTEPRWRRRLLALTDQAASSLSNILIFVLVARSFDSIEPVGAFSAAMLAYQLLVGIVRGMTGRAFLSLYSHVEPGERRAVVPELLATAFTVAVVGAVAVALVGLLVGGMVGSALLALALVLPIVLVQDTWRFALVVDRPGATLTLDLLWLGLVVVAFPFVPTDAAVSWFIYLWGAGALVGVVVAWPLAGQTLRRCRLLGWVVDHREVGLRYAGEFSTARATNYVVTSSLGVIGGLATLGAVRASQIYYGPHHTLHGGIALAVVPEGARLRGQPDRIQRLMSLVSGGLVAVAGVWMVVGLLLPDTWGEAVLGATWAEARPLMAPMGVGIIASGVMSGALLGLQSLADARRSLRARLSVTPFQIVLPLVGVVVGGAVGFAFGFAATQVIAAVVWWRAFRASLADGVDRVDIDGSGREVSPDAAHEEVTV